MREIHPFMLPAGLVLGLIFSATTAAVPVWLAQVTIARGWFMGVRTAFSIAATNAFWAMIAAALLFLMGQAYANVSAGFRGGAVAVLLYMALMAVQSPRLQTLDPGIELPDDVVAFTLRRSFWMPMRLPGFFALIIAVNLPLRIAGTGNALLLAIGIGAGSLLWGAFFATVAWFGRSVDDAICVRSLNKLRTLSAGVLVLLAGIAFVPFLMKL